MAKVHLSRRVSSCLAALQFGSNLIIVEQGSMSHQGKPSSLEANSPYFSALGVMSAIERCRTAALGGHVARCENDRCAHTIVSYYSRLMGKLGNGESANSDAPLPREFDDFALH
jgi:hypothetical protein